LGHEELQLGIPNRLLYRLSRRFPFVESEKPARGTVDLGDAFPRVHDEQPLHHTAENRFLLVALLGDHVHALGKARRHFVHHIGKRGKLRYPAQRYPPIELVT
jgi:hypothetical protein